MDDRVKYAASPNIGIDRHVRSAILTLGRQLDFRKPIYLDTKFWIILRKVALGERTYQARKLLHLLREKVASGQIFCPISETTFIEITKQIDPASRIETAFIVDELSLGVSLIEQKARIATEVSYFMHASTKEFDLEPLKHLVWCKLPYALGVFHGQVPALGPYTNLAMQKAVFDRMWSISLKEMMATTTFPNADFEQARIAENLNAGISAHKDELRSYAQAYAAEANGIADLLSDTACDVMVDMAAEKGIRLDTPTPSQRQDSKRGFQNLMRVALMKDKARDTLRSMHILASLHASLRWNKQQKFKDNDLFDFNHAAAALAYCDAFFTEGPLRAMVTASNVALDKRYNCYVAATVDDAIGWLETLGPSRV